VSQQTPSPDWIYCDCCGKRVMARLENGKLIIVNHNHGKNHVVTLPVEFFADMTQRPIDGGLTKIK